MIRIHPQKERTAVGAAVLLTCLLTKAYHASTLYPTDWEMSSISPAFPNTRTDGVSLRLAIDSPHNRTHHR